MALMILLVVLLTCLLELPAQGPPFLNVPPTSAVPPGPCPSKQPNLVSFPTGYDVILTDGKNYILKSNATVNTITITNGASLTVADDGTAITLRTKYILIENNGALRIGSESCRHQSPLEIVLYGLSNDTLQNAAAGTKFILASPTTSIEIHGPWKLAWTFINTTIEPGATDFVVTLSDDATSWKPGDRVVVATSDYDMEHAEEFDLVECTSCTPYQIKVKGPAMYRHLGAVMNYGVDVRAEIGILTRNIKIRGEMQKNCYGDNQCTFFDFDTFGGTTEVLYGARVAHFEGIEMVNMGQQILARYPIHFHRALASYGNYVKQLSIHHCFNRCVTIHSTMGILVEDVVGYDTIGHCFFLEDGNEVDNVFLHNLGLVTRHGTILPSDRSDFTCTNLTANPAVYLPDTIEECRGVSTFWIPHPANNLTNNAAAGSADLGFFFLFHRVPTGPSANLLPPFHGERSPLRCFNGNRAHANGLFGFYLDRGVKVDLPSSNDPRDFLALIPLERYQPHVDRNLSLPRVPAHLTDFTGYSNAVGMLVRGGDVWISNAKLADNDVALIVNSSPTLPYDQGSHQELVNSVVVGKSQTNSDWSSRDVPCVGVEVQDGPILIANNLFASFPTDPKRKSYAIGFSPNNSGLYSPANTIDVNEFIDVDTKLFFGQVGPYFGNYNMDGDLTQIVYDKSGKITASTPVYAVRSDYPLLDNDNTCVASDGFKYCTPRDFGLLFVNASSKDVQFAIEDLTTQSGRLVLQGYDRDDDEHPTTIQFQPVLIANHTYRINWLDGAAPSSLNFSLINFDQNSVISLEICYPPTTVFLSSASLFVLNQATDTVTSAGSVQMSSNYSTFDQTFGSEAQYFWNATAGILYVKLQVLWSLPASSYSYCARDGCHFFNLVANVTDSSPYTCF
jgi:hypothetical protein